VERELAKKRAAEAESSIRPPEVRVKTVSNNGKVIFTFTNEMVLTEDLLKLLDSQKDTNRQRSLTEDKQSKSLIEVIMLSYEAEAVSENLVSWSISSFDSN